MATAGVTPMRSGPWRSILVAVRDPGERRQPALRKAARLAGGRGARVTLFHAFSTPYPLPDPLPADPGRILATVARQRRAQLMRLAEPLRAAGLKVTCKVAWDFPPAHAIVRQVLAQKPDLVVAESHRRTRLARWFLASADWDLIRECPCPVWFVKGERLAARPLVLTAVDPAHSHAKPSGLDDRLLRAAATVSHALDGRLALVHVEDVSMPGSVIALPGLPLVTIPPPPGTARAAVARLGRRHGVAEADQHLRRGVPATALTAAAARLKADVLVMGAVSRRGLGEAFIGNTAEAVIDRVGCDVLVVKPRQFRTSVPRQGRRLYPARRR